MGREFELKYAATPQLQAAIREAFGGFTAISMETTYYDTPDGTLSREHITLRRRLENGVNVCTVKTPDSGHGRGEWELECDNIYPALEKLCQLGCPYDLPALTVQGLRPICGAQFTRQAAEILLPDAKLELALDSGVLRGGDREQRLCEVEVELKEGSEAAVVAFAEALKLRFGLTEEPKSKFRRARDLAKGE